MNLQPLPKPHGEKVTPKLIDWIQNRSICPPLTVETAVNLVKIRSEFGCHKYGQPLMSKDGRDSVKDAMEELGDLLQYVYKARMNGESTKSLKIILPILQQLLE